MSLLISVRSIDTGMQLKGQQISDDSGQVQRKNLARKLISKITASEKDVYVAEVQDGVAIRKYQV